MEKLSIHAMHEGLIFFKGKYVTIRFILIEGKVTNDFVKVNDIYVLT